MSNISVKSNQSAEYYRALGSIVSAQANTSMNRTANHYTMLSNMVSSTSNALQQGISNYYDYKLKVREQEMTRRFEDIKFVNQIREMDRADEEAQRALTAKTQTDEYTKKASELLSKVTTGQVGVSEISGAVDQLRFESLTLESEARAEVEKILNLAQNHDTGVEGVDDFLKIGTIWDNPDHSLNEEVNWTIMEHTGNTYSQKDQKLARIRDTAKSGDVITASDLNFVKAYKGEDEADLIKNLSDGSKYNHMDYLMRRELRGMDAMTLKDMNSSVDRWIEDSTVDTAREGRIYWFSQYDDVNKVVPQGNQKEFPEYTDLFEKDSKRLNLDDAEQLHTAEEVMKQKGYASLLGTVSTDNAQIQPMLDSIVTDLGSDDKVITDNALKGIAKVGVLSVQRAMSFTPEGGVKQDLTMQHNEPHEGLGFGGGTPEVGDGSGWLYFDKGDADLETVEQQQMQESAQYAGMVYNEVSGMKKAMMLAETVHDTEEGTKVALPYGVAAENYAMLEDEPGKSKFGTMVGFLDEATEENVHIYKTMPVRLGVLKTEYDALFDPDTPSSGADVKSYIRKAEKVYEDSNGMIDPLGDPMGTYGTESTANVYMLQWGVTLPTQLPDIMNSEGNHYVDIFASGYGKTAVTRQAMSNKEYKKSVEAGRRPRKLRGPAALPTGGIPSYYKTYKGRVFTPRTSPSAGASRSSNLTVAEQVEAGKRNARDAGLMGG